MPAEQTILTTEERLRAAADVLHKEGMPWLAFFVIGFPSETEAEMRETLQMLYELEPTAALMRVVTPYPGTELFDHAIQSKRLDNDAWLHADTYKLESALVDTMTPEAFRRLAAELSRKFVEYNENVTKRNTSPLKRVARRAARRVYLVSEKVLGEERADRWRSYWRG